MADANPEPPPEPDPVIDAYERDIDMTLIRENLKLSVAERFEKFRRFMDTVYELRTAGERARQQGRRDGTLLRRAATGPVSGGRAAHRHRGRGRFRRLP